MTNSELSPRKKTNNRPKAYSNRNKRLPLLKPRILHYLLKHEKGSQTKQKYMRKTERKTQYSA